MADRKIPAGEDGKPKKTPRGHIAVYVGEEMRRFVVHMSFLKNPEFRQLLEEAAEVYGFHGQGGIMLPCSEDTFHRVISFKKPKSW